MDKLEVFNNSLGDGSKVLEVFQSVATSAGTGIVAGVARPDGAHFLSFCLSLAVATGARLMKYKVLY